MVKQKTDIELINEFDTARIAWQQASIKKRNLKLAIKLIRECSTSNKEPIVGCMTMQTLEDALSYYCRIHTRENRKMHNKQQSLKRRGLLRDKTTGHWNRGGN